MNALSTNKKSKIILEVKDLDVSFSVKVKEGFFNKKREVHVLNKISFKLHEEETIGIVGESGCGKSTLAKAILRTIENNSKVKGEVLYLGQDITQFNDKQMREVRKTMQVIFQDPLASLNPRMTVFQIISEPLRVYKKHLTQAEIRAEVERMMSLVGLSPKVMNRYPHEFSGGQNQRIGIARAIILKPKLLICDEAVSALDVSIKSQIVNLLQDLKNELKMSILFISHDLSIVKYISDYIQVLYLGEVMELARSNDIYDNPLHPYTQMLISSVPIPDPEVEHNRNKSEIIGEIPSLLTKRVGCPFTSRCAYVMPKCETDKPELINKDRSSVACHKVNG